MVLDKRLRSGVRFGFKGGVMARKCENPACSVLLEGRRKGARACSPACRTAAWRVREGWRPAPPREVCDYRLDAFVRELVSIAEDPTVQMTLPDAIRAAGRVAGVVIPLPLDGVHGVFLASSANDRQMTGT